jgi:hypothetical protein
MIINDLGEKMAVKIKVQKDYFRTEASIELPADVAQVHEILRTTKTNGKMVVLYYEGFVQGINIEQNTKIPEHKSEEVRAILEIGDKNL